MHNYIQAGLEYTECQHNGNALPIYRRKKDKFADE